MPEPSLVASGCFFNEIGSLVVSHITNSHAINALSFSHDGEYLAISNTSTYIDIVSFPSDPSSSLLLTRCSVRCGNWYTNPSGPYLRTGLNGDMASLQTLDRVLRTDKSPRRFTNTNYCTGQPLWGDLNVKVFECI